MNEEKIEFRDNLHFSIKIQSIERYPIHWHENITEILIPIKGCIEVFVNYEHILVKEGDFWFVNNKTTHSVRASPGAIVAVFYINLDYFQEQFEHIKYMFFRSNMFSKIRKKIESDNFEDEIRKGLKIQFRNLLVNMLDNIVNDIQLSEKFLENFESQLICSMVYGFCWLRFLKKNNKHISSFQINRYHRVIKFIDENYKNKIALEDVASREFVTKNYFSHFWKDLNYFSFQERLNYERTIRAEMLLLTTDINISQISEECGFSDVKYFYNCFKQWYRSTPSEHKKRCLLYEKKGADYQNLKFSDIKETLNSYINTYLPSYNINSQIPMFSSFIKNCHKIKHLYQADKDMISKSPRNIVIDIFNRNNFCIRNGYLLFNWYIIDQLVDITDSLPFYISIKLDHKYIEKPWFNYIIEKFLDFCIFRYGINTVKGWEFYVDYRGYKPYNVPIALRKIIENKTANIKTNYFFEI